MSIKIRNKIIKQLKNGKKKLEKKGKIKPETLMNL